MSRLPESAIPVIDSFESIGCQRLVEANIARPRRTALKGPYEGRTVAPSAAKPVPRSRRPIKKKGIRSTGVPKTLSKNLVGKPGGTAWVAVSRASSSRVPYSTPEGQTGSQARQPKQRSMCVLNASELGSSLPSTTACMRCRRPLGESASFPRRLYVGQAGRQNPQCTQGSRRSLCASRACPSASYAGVPFTRCPTVWIVGQMHASDR